MLVHAHIDTTSREAIYINDINPNKIVYDKVNISW